MKVSKEDIIKFIKEKGPVLPIQISQEIGTNLLFASAILAELVSNKLVMISNAKIGSSPVYYIKGQEPKLQMLYKNLGGKPKKAYDLLKEKKVIRDKGAEPWQRIALRELKDFAVMLNVRFGETREIFWKWYLASDDDAKAIIKDIFEKEAPVKKEKPEEEEKKEEPKEEKEAPKKITKQKKEEVQEELIKDNIQVKAEEYFKENNIKALESKLIAKNKEIDFVAELGSSVGDVTFFINVKNKKKINETDMLEAVHRAKGRPVLFLSPGALTKKAEAYLEKNLKGSLIFKKI